ncbi:Mth938-like domain-containing protein [Lysobacter arenosi]|uniref:Mth938-like domain-containing protein n=1 Tax=Lysobacter arenosi TaxID=2795387 RepID=A0ABX7RE02_9GAMM|nr:Mth938-like domain-containing protein [Lysobacter arenosi]QSX76389.1 Mth938-like domain-containing protein [Lysobacter arenosi]
MQLNLEHPDQSFYLRAADGTSALVNDRRLYASFVLSPDQLIEDWPVSAVKAITPQDLDPVLAMEPEVILLGSGATQVFPTAAVMAACLGRGVGLETMTNAAAARTFNVLSGEGRRVVAAFVFERAP